MSSFGEKALKINGLAGGEGINYLNYLTLQCQVKGLTLHFGRAKSFEINELRRC